MKLDGSFNQEWVQTWFQDTICSGLGVASTMDGGFAVGGTVGGRAVILKTDSIGNIPYTVVRGNVVADANANCAEDVGEHLLSNQLVKITTRDEYYGYTSANGTYTVEVFDSGSAQIDWYPNSYWTEPSCQTSGTTVTLLPNDTLDFDIFVEPTVSCPNLTVNLHTPFLRRCFSNTFTISYCNDGTVPADSGVVEISFDSFLNVNSASVPYTALGGNVYRFDAGSIGIGQCGSYKIWAHLACDSTVLGQTHCVEAHIYPDSICLSPDPIWDGSSLKINSQCVDDTVRFELINQGTGNMSGPMQYIIVEDNVMYKQGQFQLNGGQSIFEIIPANGKTYTMIALQSEGHPGYSSPLKSIEGCGRDNQNSFSTGFLTQFPQDDADDFIDILCLENVGSYDPNDKRPEPLGISAEGYINATQPLDYTIRFQNTGTDTAVTVVIRDTLSAHLDITTLRLNGASHTYTFQIIGSNVLEWTFPNILLPDSNVNEPLSHGFVGFGISQQDVNAPGTEITNRAGIYFDFNAPVITNTTFNTVIENYKRGSRLYNRRRASCS